MVITILTLSQDINDSYYLFFYIIYLSLSLVSTFLRIFFSVYACEFSEMSGNP
jgi:hypothetical protein